MGFANRPEAGRRLALELGHLATAGAIVLGIPRGGVPVAFEIARTLRAPLDVIITRKIGVPSQPELAMGAIGEDGGVVVNYDVVRTTNVTEEQFDLVEHRERTELIRRVRRFREIRTRTSLRGRTAIVVDDGIATGSTARAACQIARRAGAARVVLAVPVAPPLTLVELSEVCDELVCLETPEHFDAVGRWYREFPQTSDQEVIDLLRAAHRQGEPDRP
ncbi:MAG TPA: phosphoribosyltransferase [Acidimicrobiales bacterium]|nr:phosphoribosyltransferase [Acidimicrobiales bacterium]